VYSGKKSKKGEPSNFNRPKISKRQPLNRYELEKPSLENASTSASKLSAFDPDEFEVEHGFGYRILNFLTVFTATRASTQPYGLWFRNQCPVANVFWILLYI